jgi:XTP/dITP diphosphohydrolase
MIKNNKLMDERLSAFGRLLDIMDELREKCPWDKNQTLESLRNLTLEEAYELADAITRNDLMRSKRSLAISFFTLFSMQGSVPN